LSITLEELAERQRFTDVTEIFRLERRQSRERDKAVENG
jgi:hypothetical protein